MAKGDRGREEDTFSSRDGVGVVRISVRADVNDRNSKPGGKGVVGGG